MIKTAYQKCLKVKINHICAGLVLSIQILNDMFMTSSIINYSYHNSININGA